MHMTLGESAIPKQSEQIPLKVPNVKFDFDVNFLMYVFGTAGCQQIQINRKRNLLICTL